MATVAGTVTGVTLLSGPGTGAGNRKVYEVAASFTVYTASSDSAQITGIQDRIEEITKSGKTLTLISAGPGNPGVNTAGVAVYAIMPVTNTSGTLAFELGSDATTEANTAACAGVKFICVVDES